MVVVPERLRWYCVGLPAAVVHRLVWMSRGRGAVRVVSILICREDEAGCHAVMTCLKKFRSSS